MNPELLLPRDLAGFSVAWDESVAESSVLVVIRWRGRHYLAHRRTTTASKEVYDLRDMDMPLFDAADSEVVVVGGVTGLHLKDSAAQREPTPLAELVTARRDGLP
jgi:hypothetical protein